MKSIIRLISIFLTIVILFTGTDLTVLLVTAQDKSSLLIHEEKEIDNLSSESEPDEQTEEFSFGEEPDGEYIYTPFERLDIEYDDYYTPFERLEIDYSEFESSSFQSMSMNMQSSGSNVIDINNYTFDEIISGDVIITATTNINNKTVLYEGNVTVAANVSVNSSMVIVLGTVNINSGFIILSNDSEMYTFGDFRIQSSNWQGYTATWGHAHLSGNAKLTVYGDFYTQTFTANNFSDGNPNDPAILELHGNFNQIGWGNSFFTHANENGFKLVFAGNGEQRVITYKNDATVNLGMIEVNHSELYFDTPIYQLWVAQDTVVNGNINAQIIKNPDSVLEINGDLIMSNSISFNDDLIVTGNVYFANIAGFYVAPDVNITVGGDFRIQSSNWQGYTATWGHAHLSGNAKLTVYGDFYTQTFRNGDVNNPHFYFSNGDPNNPAILELHGNFNQIWWDSFFTHANENGFKLVFAGNGEQRVITYKNDATVNLGMIEVNHSELYFDTPIYQLWVAQDTVVNCNINAQIIKNPDSVLEINGDLIMSNSISFNDDLIVTGNVYFANIAGFYVAPDVNITVGGDFRIQSRNNQGGYTATWGHAHLSGNAKLTVYGDFYTQTFRNGDVNNPHFYFSNGDSNDPAILELHGNFNQIWWDSFFTHANENGFKLVFAGNGEQRVRTDRSDFNVNLGMIEVINPTQSLHLDTPLYKFHPSGSLNIVGDLNAQIIGGNDLTFNINGSFIVNHGTTVNNYMNVTGDVIINNAVALNRNMNIGGDLRIQAPSGNTFIGTSGYLQLGNGVNLTVLGGVYSQSISTHNFSGNAANNPATLELQGSLYQIGNTFFNNGNSGGLRIVLSGKTDQYIYFDNFSQSNLGRVSKTNASNLNLLTSINSLTAESDMAISGTSSITNINLNGYTVQFKTPAYLTNVTLSGGALICNENLHLNGTLNINDGLVNARKNLIINSGGNIAMSSDYSYLIVQGDMTVNTNNNITLNNGLFDLKGDLVITTAARFTTGDNILTQLSGGGNQNITFPSNGFVHFYWLAVSSDYNDYVITKGASSFYLDCSYVNGSCGNATCTFTSCSHKFPDYIACGWRVGCDGTNYCTYSYYGIPCAQCVFCNICVDCEKNKVWTDIDFGTCSITSFYATQLEPNNFYGTSCVEILYIEDEDEEDDEEAETLSFSINSFSAYNNYAINHNTTNSLTPLSSGIGGSEIDDGFVNIVIYAKAMGATVNEYKQNGIDLVEVKYNKRTVKFIKNSGKIKPSDINNIFGWTYSWIPNGKSHALYVGAHHIAGGQYHTTLFIFSTPDNATNFNNNNMFKLYDNSNVVVSTLGAGNLNNKLISNINHLADINTSSKIEMLYIDEHDINKIDSLFAFELYYRVRPNDSPAYKPLPTFGLNYYRPVYNSNSFTNGLLQTADITGWEPNCNVPGWDKPLPHAFFK